MLNSKPLPSTELNKYIELFLFMDVLSINVYSSYNRGVDHFRITLSGIIYIYIYIYMFLYNYKIYYYYYIEVC